MTPERNQELEAALLTYALSLLPPGRQPTPGGLAHALVRALTATQATAHQEALALALDRLASTASEDMLDQIGHARNIHRYPDERLDAYRERVRGAFEFWALAGTVPGMRLALHQLGYDGTIIEHYHDEPDHWAEFSLELRPDRPNLYARRWGEFAWGQADVRWGRGMRPGEPDRIRAVIRDVKPAHTRLRTIWYFTSASFRWGEPGVPWGARPWGARRVLLS